MPLCLSCDQSFPADTHACPTCSESDTNTDPLDGSPCSAGRGQPTAWAGCDSDVSPQEQDEGGELDVGNGLSTLFDAQAMWTSLVVVQSDYEPSDSDSDESGYLSDGTLSIDSEV